MRPLVLALVGCSSLAWSGASRAQGPSPTDAHDAYARGTAAYRRGDYATAAREYAAADALAPNPVAMQAALDATILADDPVLGTTLLDRARGEPRTDALLATMLTAERKFAHRVGRIRIDCPSAPCLGAIDGVAAIPGTPTVVRVGSHTVTLEGAGTVLQRVVTVAPDDTVVVHADAPPPPPPVPLPLPPPSPPPPTPQPLPRPHDQGGLSPLWVYGGVAATAVAGGLAIGFGVETSQRHQTFEEHPTGQLASQGQSLQTATNVFIGVTVGLTVVTVVSTFFVRWGQVQLSADARRVAFDVRF